jgi:hypothetical protein
MKMLVLYTVRIFSSNFVCTHGSTYACEEVVPLVRCFSCGLRWCGSAVVLATSLEVFLVLCCAGPDIFSIVCCSGFLPSSVHWYSFVCKYVYICMRVTLALFVRHRSSWVFFSRACGGVCFYLTCL